MIPHPVLSFALLFLGHGAAVWCVEPPSLNVTGQVVVDVEAAETFALSCRGHAKLSWHHPQAADFEYLSIEHHHHEFEEFEHTSVLQITYPERVDTGVYRCVYADTPDVGTQTYVYFDDPGQSFVSGEKYLPVSAKTNDELVLDCRTTHPAIAVNLTKDGDQVSVANTWDPHVGFRLNHLAVQDSGHYKCTSDRGHWIMFFVDITVSSELPKPAFEDISNQHFVVGHDFTLQCHLMNIGQVNFTWTLPNPNAVYEVEGVSEVRGGGRYEGSVLRVRGAAAADSGQYACTASSHRYSPSTTTINVQVKDSQTAYVSIESVASVVLEEGQPLHWKALVQTFPPNPAIVYRDGYGQVINNTARMGMKYDAKKAESWLFINHTSLEDFGKYTIEVSVKDGTIVRSKELFLYINSKPYTELHGVSESVDAGDTVLVSCLAAGWPESDIHWAFRSCPDGVERCITEFVEFDPEDSAVTYPLPGNIKNTTIPFKSTSSGIIGCYATNDFGSMKATQNISISDIGGNFVFRYDGESGPMDLRSYEGEHTVNITEHDMFSLTCGGTQFLYENISLTGPGGDSDIQRTNHSLVGVVQFDSVGSDVGGSYTCSAHPHSSATPQSHTVLFNVLKEKIVVFTEGANMMPDGVEMTVKESEPLWLNCTVTGLPPPTIRWFKDGNLLTHDSPIFDGTAEMSDDEQSIRFTYVFQDTHVGTYSCEAQNRLGAVTGSITLAVQRPGLSNLMKIVVGVTAVGIVLLVVIIFCLIKRVKTERRFRKSFRENELYLFEKGNIGQLNPDCTADEQADLLPYNQDWEIHRASIIMGRQLGAGAFGRVVKGIVTGLEGEKSRTVVAVKMCRSTADKAQLQTLTRELKVMIHLGKHLNIVNLIGANTIHVGKGELWILVEFCRYGNLLSFMHRHRRDFINQINPYTGKIDPHKTLQDTMTHPAQSMQSLNSRNGYPLSPVTDQNGYLSPIAPGSNGGSAPLYYSNSPAPPDVHRQFADNPFYRMGWSNDADGRAASQHYDIPRKTASQHYDIPRMSHPLNSKGSSSNSDHGSWGYGEVPPSVNTDMTMLPPPSPHRLSSFSASDVGLDSHGNAFPFDIGPTPGVSAPFTTSDLVCWSWQVAQGMDYLTRRKVLHGDLAARNLLLADNNVVKISDFGLSRDMYKKDIYMKKGDDLMPIKWMSVEAIRDRIFSVQSDVWAYGVTLWELFTLGSVPYPALEANKEFLTYLEEGKRMDQPKFANKEIYDILLSCWEADPSDRPAFSLIAERLGFLMLPDLRGQYMTMNDPYMRMNEERFRVGPDYLNMLASPDFDHLHQKDGVGHTYVNVQDACDDSRNSTHPTLNPLDKGEGEGQDTFLTIASPDTVGYSKVALDQPPNYLPMDGVKQTRSGIVSV